MAAFSTCERRGEARVVTEVVRLGEHTSTRDVIKRPGWGG